MDKRLWVNVGLLGCIIVLSLFLLNSDETPEEVLPKVSNIDAESIVNIEIIRKDLDDFIFTKQGTQWLMTNPLQYRANEARINAMLRILKADSHANLNPDDHDLNRFELEDPIIIMRLNEHEFKFGNTDAIDQRRYVLFDNTIHLTNDFLYSQLTTNAAFFADTKLFAEPPKIQSIQLKDYRIEFVDKHWQIQPLRDIKPGQLQRMVFNWQNAMAISVSKFNPPETEQLVSLTMKDGNMVEFVIVATEPHLILGRKDIGIQYHMGSDEAEKLLLNKPAEAQTESEASVEG